MGTRGGAFRATLRLSWRASAYLTIALAILVAAGGIIPVGYTIMVGLVVGAVLPAIGGGFHSAAGHHLLILLGVLGAMYLGDAVLSSARSATASSLGQRFTIALRHAVLRATLAPSGIAHVEDPKAIDELDIIGSDEQRWYAENVITNLSTIGSAKISGIGSAIILARFHLWAPFVLLVGIVLGYRWIEREIENFYSSIEAETPGLRRASYMRSLAVRPDAAKEIRVFGLARWSVAGFATAWTAAMSEIWRTRKGHAWPLVHYALGQLAGYVAVYGTIVYAAFTHRISVAALTVFAGAVAGFFSLGNNGDPEWGARRGVKLVGRLTRLADVFNTPDATLTGERPIDRVSHLRFEDVTFAYPGTDRPIVNGLSLDITPGSSLAIVGSNGAGKTTLIKLLGRLYDVDGGRISADGVDIRELDPDSWRKRIGVIFQDFVRFELPVAANVGFGSVEHQRDDHMLTSAAAKAGAGEIITSLPSGWDTILSRGYEGGTELSGGQWQRIALARALMAIEGGADVLVLDEPTANLDVRAEAELFDRFLEMTAGATTILISHRFSTVRRASRIVVVEEGRVVEDGSHDELLARGGTYARMFRLQAERFELEDA